MDINPSIDRTSYIPLYAQVVDAMRKYLESGEAHPGQQLPGESELCTMFDVSRTVIRQALSELERDGLISREKGKGTFVAEPKLQEGWFQKLTGFQQDYEAKGYRIRSEVLQQELISATSSVAGRLNLAAGDDVVLIKRLRFVNDEPIAIATTFTPYNMFPGLLNTDLTNQSLYAYLQNEYSIKIAWGRRTFEAVLANEIEAELLHINEGSPVLLLESISYVEGDSPFEYYKAVHRGDRSRFELKVLQENSRQMLW